MSGFRPATEITLITSITSTIEVDILSGILCFLGIEEKFCKWLQNRCLLLLRFFSSSLRTAHDLLVTQLSIILCKSSFFSSSIAKMSVND